MTIVLCGGGSGGHITPLLAVAAELRRQDKNVRLIYVGEKSGRFGHIADTSRLFDEVHSISAGKLRRYHGQSVAAKVFDIKTILLNGRDMFRLLVGIIQSYFLLRRLKPDSMFLKGGFVCVPVAMAARRNSIPYMTHDSDALPGLANRIAARWARYHATALPAKYYPYPQESVKEVGVPTDDRFRPYSKAEQAILKQKYGIDPKMNVLLVTGGSLGARRLNQAFMEIFPDLVSKNPNLYVLHQIGSGNDDQTAKIKTNSEIAASIKFFDYSPELFHMTAIADVIVTRAGATIMADLAVQKKACIVVPNPLLAGGHQLKNAEVYSDAGAALVLDENKIMMDPAVLLNAVDGLLADDRRRDELADNLHKLVPPKNSAYEIAVLLREMGTDG